MLDKIQEKFTPLRFYQVSKNLHLVGSWKFLRKQARLFLYKELYFGEAIESRLMINLSLLMGLDKVHRNSLLDVCYISARRDSYFLDNKITIGK